MKPSLHHAVILGAGRPARGQLPSALWAIAGHGRVLDWLVGALGQSCKDVTFVGGYRFPEIVAHYPSLVALINPNWASTGTVSSLLRADPRPDRACVVSYADILYRDALVRQLCGHAADCVIAVDSRWRQRYDNRSVADMASAEVLTLRGGYLLSAHGRSTSERPAQPDAEFVGLAKLGQRALELLQSWAARPEVACWDLPQLLNALLAQGLQVAAIDCEGDWAELNAPQDLARFVLGTKAQTLERLRPRVKHSHIGEQIAFTVGEWQRDGAGTLQRVHTAFGAARLVVRSSALGEDGFEASGAGRFESVLDVDGRQPRAISQAIDRVTASYGDNNPAHQILVQRLVEDVCLSGVAMTRTLSHGAPYRVINYDAASGASDSVTAGRGNTLQTLYVHRDSRRLPTGAPPALSGLLEAVREIESLVGHDSLDIEFIVSADAAIHVLQIRPIAVDHGHWCGSDELVREALASAREEFRRLQRPGPFIHGSRAPFSVMTDWNPAEMIGTRPRRLAFSLYADLITQDVWAQQRQQYGYRSVAPQPLMRGFAGHPYIDVRASFNSFVPAELDDGLAQRLVEHCLAHLVAHPQLHDKVEFEVVFTCLGFDFERRAQRLRAAGFSAADVQQLRDALARLTLRAFDRVESDRAAIDTLLQRQPALAAAELPALRRALLLLDDCRAHGTLPFAHLARGGFVAMALLNSAVDVGVISVAERAAYLQSVSTVAAEYRSDCDRLHAGELTLPDFLARHGHLRPGTYDLTVPSYAEDPARYLDAATSVQVQVHAPAGASVDVAEAWPHETRNRFAAALAEAGLSVGFEHVDRFMRQAIAGRELAKHSFTRSLSQALDLIACFGAEIGLTRDELSHLSLADLRAHDAGWLCNDAAGRLRERAEEGRLAHEVALGVELPPLLLSEDDFASFLYPDTAPNFIGNAAITAGVVCVEKPVSAPGALAGKIVLISQADPGCDWLFAHGIAGLITAYGGANSHMAVRAAEFGLPAAIGVGERRYHHLAMSTRLVLDCQQRTITPLH